MFVFHVTHQNGMGWWIPLLKYHRHSAQPDIENDGDYSSSLNPDRMSPVWDVEYGIKNLFDSKMAFNFRMNFFIFHLNNYAPVQIN